MITAKDSEMILMWRRIPPEQVTRISLDFREVVASTLLTVGQLISSKIPSSSSTLGRYFGRYPTRESIKYHKLHYLTYSFRLIQNWIIIY